MMNTGPLGISITDHEGTIVRENAYYDVMVAGKQVGLTGVKPWEICKGWSKTSGLFLQPQDWPAMQAIATGKPVLHKMICIERLDGSFGTILESAAPITDSFGRVSGARVITQDVTKAVRPGHIIWGTLLKNKRASVLLNDTILTGYSLLPGNTGFK